tara:strand:+ start:1635 stop:2312 length:678 start_codon:yes stop_codon:yes gene_type:complete
MKTVRLSEQLKHDIKRKAIDKFEKANPKQTYPADGAKLFTKYGIADKVLRTKAAFKEIWDRDVPMDSVERIQLSSTAMETRKQWDHEKEDYVEQQEESNFTFTLNIPITKIPSFMVNYSDFKLEVPPDDETFIECYQVQVANDNLSSELSAFRRNIQETLDKFHTLNQLLKAAPYIKDLVPEDRLQRMYEKDDRGKRVKQQAEMADNELSDLREVLLEDKLLGDD